MNDEPDEPSYRTYENARADRRWFWSELVACTFFNVGQRSRVDLYDLLFRRELYVRRYVVSQLDD